MISLRHLGITVDNIEKMENFYCNLLGCEVYKIMQEEGACIDNFSGIENIKVTTSKMNLPGGGLLELLKYHSPANTSFPDQNRQIIEVGLSHLALTVDNLDLLYENLMKEGIVFLYPVQASPDGNVKIAFCRDPEGNLIELVEEL